MWTSQWKGKSVLTHVCDFDTMQGFRDAFESAPPNHLADRSCANPSSRARPPGGLPQGGGGECKCIFLHFFCTFHFEPFFCTFLHFFALHFLDSSFAPPPPPASHLQDVRPDLSFRPFGLWRNGP